MEPGSPKAAVSQTRGSKGPLEKMSTLIGAVLGIGVRHTTVGRLAKPQNRRKHCANEEQLASLLLEDS